MRFSGKKKGKGFGSFAGGSTRGTPESHVPKGMSSDMPATPGVPGAVPGLPGGGSLPKVPKGPEHSPLYGRKVRKAKNFTPLIIFGGVGILVIVCVIVALTMNREVLEPEKVVNAYIAAVEKGDAGAYYDVMSRGKRAEFEAQLWQLKELPADLQKKACAELGIQPKKVNSLKPRDFFILAFKKTKSLPEAKGMFEKFSGIRTTACTIEGDRAWVTLRHDEIEGPGTVELVKEEGHWKISKFPGE